MTRKEELGDRANDYLRGGEQFTAIELGELLCQVERECWRKIIDEIRYRQHTVRMNERSLEEWCRDQLKELES